MRLRLFHPVPISLLLLGLHCAGAKASAANEPPQFIAGPDIEVNEDGGAQVFASWATGITSGPSTEAGQRIVFEATNKDPALFAVPPAVTPDGTLTFTPAHGAFGSAVVTLMAIDDGGTDDGGWDTSEPVEFIITILPVNDPPLFEIRSDPVVSQNSGLTVLTNWAYRFNPGSQFEVGQVLTFEVANSTPAMFVQQPVIDATGTLTFAPAPGAHGIASLSVVARDDGGTERGGIDQSAPLVFTISITPVNQPPHAEILVAPSSWLSASMNEVVVIANSRGRTKVRFDSAGSFDPDGRDVARRWFVGTEALSETNAVIVLRIETGEHDISVAVSDGFSESLANVSLEVIDPEEAVAALAAEVMEQGSSRSVRVRLLAHLRQAGRELRRNRAEPAERALMLFEREVRRWLPHRMELAGHSREIRLALREPRRR